MSFYVYFLCGIAGGILGGMGMGGGTALIPLLTIFAGVEQGVAQGVNLLSFLPMSLVALTIHAKAGLLRVKSLPLLCIPALIFSVLFSLLAAHLPGSLLRSGFGAFLVCLAVVRFVQALREKKYKKIG